MDSSTEVKKVRESNVLEMTSGVKGFRMCDIPIRPKGDWDWLGTVPGDTPATLWNNTHTGRYIE